jgi:hypothetical protein
VRLTLLVDFNEVHRDRVEGLQRYAEGPRALREGDTVLVHDDGSEEAIGRVDRVAGDLVRVAVTWGTFGAAGRFRYVKPGVWLSGDAVIAGHHDQPSPQVRAVGRDGNSLVFDPSEHSVTEPA